jgi:hypothetical protein
MTRSQLSYDNATKDTWNGWAWNQIANRIAVQWGGGRLDEWRCKSRRMRKARILADKTVLYLCGPENRDKAFALKHGFREDNVIAIDIIEKNIVVARKSGSLGISVPLEQLLLAWPKDWRIDAVLADYCGGFNDTSRVLMYSLWKCEGIKLHEKTLPVVVVNLQRGRDHQSNSARQVIAATSGMMASLLGSRCRFNAPGLNEDGSCKVDPLHRGGVWFESAIQTLWSASLGTCVLPHDDDSKEWVRLGLPTMPNALAVMQILRLVSGPQFYSYLSPRGRRVYMDSVAMSFPPSLIRTPDTEDDDAVAWEKSLDFMLTDAAYYGVGDLSDTRRKLAALRAVRTMKQRATA